MKLKFYLLTCLFIFSALLTADAQISCNYRLEMYDSFGDGWNGASVDVSVAGTSTNYTVANTDNNGDFLIVNIPVTEGDAITLNYSGGTFENEVTYFLYDSDDTEVFSDGPNPALGLVFEGTAGCPSCPKIEAETISYTSSPGGVDVTWAEGQVAGDYIVEYGPFGFTPGSGTTETVSTNSISLSGLGGGEILDFYITLDCGGGDVSSTTGPVFIQAGYIDAPLECTFQVELLAGNGFGWGGASIDVTVNNVTTNYTIAFNTNDGDFLIIDLPIQSGTLITLDYNEDAFDDDNSYRLLTPEGQELFASGNNPASGIGFQDLVFCPTCPAIDPESVTVTQIPGGFDVTWMEGQLPGDYIIEYGPLGFAQGTGTTEVVTTNAWGLSGEEEGSLWDFYVALDCGDEDISFPIGPNFAQAGFLNPPSECAYTLEMIDSFGDGWNGSTVTITINGISTEYTVLNTDNNGDFLFVDIPVTDGALISLDYSPGSFENEVTYNLLDTDGIAVFSDGPGPAVGTGVFQGVAVCPPCPLPLQSSFSADPVGANTATLNWSVVSPAVSYTVEYGENCFEPGTGTEITVTTNLAELTGLLPSTFYSYYVTGDCGAEGFSSTAGPFFFVTTPSCFPALGQNLDAVGVTDATFTVTPDPNTIDYVIEYGPTGFALGGGLVSANFDASVTVGGLTPNTTYQYFVYGDCGGTPSEALGPFFFTTDLPCAEVIEFDTGAITDNTVVINWLAVSTAINYNVEFGPTGFEAGTGVNLTVWGADTTLVGLNPGVAYDVYITTNCGGVDGLSNASEPFSFGTTGGNTCSYTLEMIDSFGDGWNGSNITVTVGTETQVFTVTNADNNGDFNIVTFEVTGGLPLILTYAPGTFEGEVTYILYNSDGEIILEDGPNPATGEVFNEIALCSGGAGCSVPFAEVSNIRAVTVDVDWMSSADASAYTVEWGPVGFTLGTGMSQTMTDTMFTITGLTPNTWYNVYVTPDCGGGVTEFSFGPMMFKTYILNDVGISGFASPTNLNCVLGSEDISVLIQNYGQNPQQLIPFFYSLDFMNASVENPTDGLFTGVVSKDSSEVIDFDNSVSFPAPGYYFFEAWTEMEGDEDSSNDTFRYELITAYPLPLRENFNGQNSTLELPEAWTSPNGVPVLAPGDNPHGLTNPVISVEFQNFGNAPDTLEFTTARHGPLELSSELKFDYRFVSADFAGNTSPYALDENDFLTVEISGDCGASYTELINITDEDNVNTLLFKGVTIDLSEYASPDSAYTFRFTATNSGGGNFFVDIDNINIAGCPENLFIQVDQSAPATFGAGNGTLFAQPTFGSAPFNFQWSNGQTTALADGLGFTGYSVTITDAFGCTSVRDFEPMLTDTEEEVIGFESLTLAPNPTTGVSQLQVSLEQVSDINVTIYDLAGRQIQTLRQDNQLSTTFDLDMNDQPNGMYLVRLQAGDAVQVMKLAVAK